MLIAFVRRWEETGWVDSRRVSASVGLFNAGRCNSDLQDGDAFFHLAGPRAAVSLNWRVARSPLGWPVLFAGWIDHHESLVEQLGSQALPLRSGDNASLYGAALQACRKSNSAKGR